MRYTPFLLLVEYVVVCMVLVLVVSHQSVHGNYTSYYLLYEGIYAIDGI